MADGEVKIDTKLDTSGIDKGVKEMQGKLDKASKQLNDGSKKSKGFADNLKGINAGAIKAAAGVGAVAVAVKKTVDALNDCEKAYKIQQKAETALQVAAKNNPYLNNESVYNLRQFASELQSMSEIGDEVSLQIMSQLAAAGRNEETIIKIMKAAADMAAVTGEDIATAAQKLNATLNGNAGMLGRQIESINNLTKEELEAGKAIELVAQQYNGSAAEMADQTVQLQNSWGDFKENIGRGWTQVTTPVRKFFTDILNDMNEALNKTADLKDANAAAEAGKETAAQAKLRLDEAQALLDQMDANKGLSERKGGIMAGQMVDPNWQKNRDAQAKKVQELTQRYNFLASSERYEAAEAVRNAEKAKAATASRTAAEARDKDASDHIEKNRKALAEQIEAIKLRAEVTKAEGEVVDDAAIAQEIYNAYINSYVDLVTKSNGLVTENNQAAKERLALLEQWAEKAKNVADAEEAAAKAKELLEKTEGLGYSTKYDDYAAKEQELLQLKEEINKSEVLSEEEKAAQILKIDEEMTKNRRQLWVGIADEINGYSQQVNSIINDAAKMALEVSNNEMKAELANLELKYRKGELGEEEYQEKVAEAKKKGARVQYQIEMAQWASNLLTATANIAVGVTQAIAQGGVAGIVTGALVGAAGAIQLASIAAAKPIQHFATGGFVGGMNGASMGADNTTIAARGGELVMNANQQRALWDMLNGTGGAGAGSGVNVVINNSAANMVTARPQITRGQIELMIDARINDGLRNGRFDGGLNAAQSGMQGEFYGM